ncbi:hypothetical protein [Bradyrhizobium forestalis]|uniref:hypothetical protein n=1 Tax=Bradyrhizobium forestalis TaxID=1419263 RepID=UPI0011AEF03F|nr:hypothetical protein [Bradyrhizobium forestalis]
MKKRRVGRLHCGLSRRSFLESTAAVLSVPLIAKATAAWAQEKLAGSGEVVVFSYGGSYTEGVRKHVYEPFTKATGISVVDVTANIAERQARAMTRAGRVDWDLVPLLSISEKNASQVVLQDDAWLAAKRPDGNTNVDYLQERWLAWRAQ